MGIATVTSGIDNLRDFDSCLKGKRLGLITGASGVNKQMRETIDILAEHYQLCALYGPEHGVRGDIQAGGKVDTYTDPKLGIPVYSIYGGDNRPSAEMLKDVDTMVFDIQEATVRFYTFLYSLSYSMEACAKNHIPMVVLDRPTPLGGVEIEGTILDPAFQSFVGDYKLPTRTGLTIGEFAKYFNDVYNVGCNLTVIPVAGWKRSLYFDEIDIPWVFPSPNIPTVDSNYCYVGTCIFEGTNISEGRGTTKPFELIGAPWLDIDALIPAVEKRGIKGALLRKTYITPVFSKHQGELCRAVQIHVTDRAACEPFKLGLYLLEEIWKLHPDKVEFRKHDERYSLDLLLGTDTFRTRQQDAESLIAAHAKGLEEFRQKKTAYHLYD